MIGCLTQWAEPDLSLRAYYSRGGGRVYCKKQVERHSS